MKHGKNRRIHPFKQRKNKTGISIYSHLLQKDENQYIANCKVVENDIVLIELNINVVNSEQAKLICDNWKQNLKTYMHT